MIPGLFRRPPLLLIILILSAVSAEIVTAAELVSASPAGTAPWGASSAPSISGDGRFVVFTTTAKLSPNDTNSQTDVYVRDRATQKTRLVSDSRGGDQPMISANGRFVVYRSLEETPHIRYVDLEGSEPPVTASYTFNGVGSLRFGDSSSVTPDGRFVLFAYRPTPFGPSDTRLCVVDATAGENQRLNAGFSITANLFLQSLGRSVMTRDGNLFFFETRDGLAPLDTGASTQDIYRIDSSGNFLRISASPGSPDESDLGPKNSAHDLTLTSDGTALFFISERSLAASDTDRAATIYRSTSADDFATPVPIATPGVRPLAFSGQATGNGDYLVFLGRSARGAQLHYILRLSDGKLVALAAGTGAAAISADNGFVTFASPAPLSPQDHNGASDVFLISNPFEESQLAPPVVTLTSSHTGTIVQGTSVNLSAAATSTNDGLVYTAIEIDGVQVRRVDGSGTVPAQNYALARGPHKIRAVALDGANIPAKSTELSITVKAPANLVVFQGITDIKRQGDAAGGPVTFTGTAHIENSFSTARGPVQLVLTEAPSDAKWELFGNDVDAAVRDENVLAVIEIPSLAPNSVLHQDFTAITRAPEVLGGQHFRGVGYTITATLRERVSGTWAKRESIDLFSLRPRLDEDTPGPNGGVPILGDPASDPNFNPALLQDVTIQGPPALVAGGSSVYSAIAVFSPGGGKPCTPQWSVTAAGVAAVITPEGRLSVGAVSAPRTVNVKAVFGDKSKTFPVLVKPISPIVSARAIKPLLPENGGEGGFRILRSPGSSSALTVTYEIGGTALPGVHYQALTGTAVILAGQAAVDVPVVPLDDNLAQGRRSVSITLLPSPEYRLRPNRTANLLIDDDEPVRADQPDATVQRGAKVVGARFFHFDGTQQQISVSAGKGTPVNFRLGFTNLTTAAEDFRISGTAGLLGFSVRYFQDGADVTDAVVGTGLSIPGIAPGASVNLVVRITATNSTPLQALMQCPVGVTTNGGFSDLVMPVVRRVH